MSSFSLLSVDRFDYTIETAAIAISLVQSVLSIAVTLPDEEFARIDSSLAAVIGLLEMYRDNSYTLTNSSYRDPSERRLVTSDPEEVSSQVMLQISFLFTRMMAPGQYDILQTSRSMNSAFLSPPASAMEYAVRLPRSDLELFDNRR